MRATYFTIKPDGADWRCDECKVPKPAGQVLACHTPDGRKRVLCRECIDEDWLAEAVHGGSV
jgi:hypothetical protein